jgi:hypothetical protein
LTQNHHENITKNLYLTENAHLKKNLDIT